MIISWLLYSCENDETTSMPFNSTLKLYFLFKIKYKHLIGHALNEIHSLKRTVQNLWNELQQSIYNRLGAFAWKWKLDVS